MGWSVNFEKLSNDELLRMWANEAMPDKEDREKIELILIKRDVIRYVKQDGESSDL